MRLRPWPIDTSRSAGKAGQESDFLTRAGDPYPVLRLTATGTALLRGEVDCSLYREIQPPKKSARRKRDGPAAGAEGAAGQEDASIRSFLESVNQSAIRYHLPAIYVTFEHEANVPAHHQGLGTPAQVIQARVEAGPVRVAPSEGNVAQWAKWLAGQLRGVRDIQVYGALKLSDLADRGPDEARAVWHTAQEVLGKDYGNLTLAELLQRF